MAVLEDVARDPERGGGIDAVGQVEDVGPVGHVRQVAAVDAFEPVELTAVVAALGGTGPGDGSEVPGVVATSPRR